MLALALGRADRAADLELAIGSPLMKCQWPPVTVMGGPAVMISGPGWAAKPVAQRIAEVVANRPVRESS